jgi:hypothetical protein
VAHIHLGFLDLDFDLDLVLDPLGFGQLQGLTEGPSQYLQEYPALIQLDFVANNH